MAKKKNTQSDQNKKKYKTTSLTSSQSSTSGKGVIEVTKNKKSILATVNSHQSLLSDTETTEMDTNKKIRLTSSPRSGLSLTIKNNDMRPNDKYEVLLPLFKPLHTKLEINTILVNSNNLLNNTVLEIVQVELEEVLVSLAVFLNAINTQVDTLENFPCELTADNHIIITEPKVIKNLSNNDFTISHSSDPKTKNPPLTKNHAFWSFVRNYADDVHTNDINWLKRKLESYSDQKPFNIPPLGENYTNNLLKKIIKIQTNESITEQMSTDVIELLNEINNSTHSTKSTAVLGKVMSCLTEHSLKVLNNKELSEDNDTDKSPELLSNFSKEFYSDPKKQLQKLALSSSSACTNEFSQTDDDHDEILDELTKCDNMLREVQETNKKQLQDLLKKCQVNYCRKFIKNKLEIINTKITNFKRKKNTLWTAEQEMAQISKEDDEIKFLIQQRSIYLAQLETVTKCHVQLVDLKYTGQITTDEQLSNTISSDIETVLPNKVCVMTAPSKGKNYNYEILTKKKGKLNLKMPVINTSLDINPICQKTRNIQDTSQRYLEKNLKKTNNKKKHNELPITVKTIGMKSSNEYIIKEIKPCTSAQIKQRRGRPPKSKNALVTEPRSNAQSNQNITAIDTATVADTDTAINTATNTATDMATYTATDTATYTATDTVNNTATDTDTATAINVINVCKPSLYDNIKVNKSSCVNNKTIGKHFKPSMKKRHTYKIIFKNKKDKKNCTKQVDQVALENKNDQNECQINVNHNMKLYKNSMDKKNYEITNAEKSTKNQSHEKPPNSICNLEKTIMCQDEKSLELKHATNKNYNLNSMKNLNVQRAVNNSDFCYNSKINRQEMNEALSKFNFHTNISPEFFYQFVDFDGRKMLNVDNQNSETDICSKGVQFADERSQTFGDKLKTNIKPNVNVNKEEGECSTAKIFYQELQ